jgi:hypothetical protein
MIRRFLVAATVAVVWTVTFAAPALAHGDHDARPLARGVAAGPYVVSLWQVYPDVGSAMTPLLIVMFDGLAAPPPGVTVGVTVNGTASAVHPSTTTSNGFETTGAVVEGDVVAVTVAGGGSTWELAPVVVPPPPTSLLPMEELLYGAIFLTIGTAWWMVGRAGRAWRRPSVKLTGAAPAG